MKNGGYTWGRLVGVPSGSGGLVLVIRLPCHSPVLPELGYMFFNGARAWSGQVARVSSPLVSPQAHDDRLVTCGRLAIGPYGRLPICGSQTSPVSRLLSPIRCLFGAAPVLLGFSPPRPLALRTIPRTRAIETLSPITRALARSALPRPAAHVAFDPWFIHQGHHRKSSSKHGLIRS
jgi:hypothetical protein